MFNQIIQLISQGFSLVQAVAKVLGAVVNLFESLARASAQFRSFAAI